MSGANQLSLPVQMSFFPSHNVDKPAIDLSSTFSDNMKLPIHRWFKYSAGFSAKWVEKTISDNVSKRNISVLNTTDFVVLDPFAGSGTTLLAAEQMGIRSIGFEAHPLIAKIASVKLLWDTDVFSLREYANNIVMSAQNASKELDFYPNIVYRCYDKMNLTAIDNLKYALKNFNDGSNEYHLCWLAFLSILRSTSHAGTAQWQYLLPGKSKVNVLNVYHAFIEQISRMCYDIISFRPAVTGCNRSSIIQHDARIPYNPLKNTVDLVITSPPYANNYDYADATRLELCILGEITGWGDLQNTVRHSLIRSCSQQVS
ncbi:MAG: site-specific DNA-methyltransferase, partial [Oscillospiraceae bacterium]|nr:site-specific DNA-methyltransferase [Oscillospiraceae bacterium]